MEKRTIRITGIGRASAKVDYIVINMTLKVVRLEYEDAMREAGAMLDDLRASLAKVGFEKEDLKTTSFSVDTSYNSYTDVKGNYKRVFVSYEVDNRLRLALNFDIKRLAQTIEAIAGCESHPEFTIRFSVKNPETLKTAILKDAAENAKKKALTLCEATGTTLGEIITIDHSWTEVDFYSRTRYEMSEVTCCAAAPSSAANIEIEPEDIKTSDNVTFIWEIK